MARDKGSQAGCRHCQKLSEWKRAPRAQQSGGAISALCRKAGCLRRPMHMTDWIAKLDAFLTLNEGNILTHAGSIYHELAVAHAEQEYDKFHRQRQLEARKKESDFAKAVKVLTDGKMK